MAYHGRRYPAVYIQPHDFYNTQPAYFVDEEGVEYGPCTLCWRSTWVSCGKCGAFYCSEKCQRFDWRRHRVQCVEGIPRLSLKLKNFSGAGDVRERRDTECLSKRGQYLNDRVVIADVGRNNAPIPAKTKGSEGSSIHAKTAPIPETPRLNLELRNRCGAGDVRERRDTECLSKRGQYLNDRVVIADVGRNNAPIPAKTKGSEGSSIHAKTAPIPERPRLNLELRNRCGAGDVRERRDTECLSRRGQYLNDRVVIADVDRNKAAVPAKTKGSEDTSIYAKTASIPERNSLTVRADTQLQRPLSSLLKKADKIEPLATHPAEDGVCIQLKNGDLVVIQCSENTDSTYISSAAMFLPGDFITLAQNVLNHCLKAPVLNRKPRAKEMVGCLDTSSGVYCRAVVSSVLPDGAYNMFFVDFGNEERCEADQLREIPDDLKILPRQAVKIRFRDVDPASTTHGVKELLESLIDDGVSLELQFDKSVENGVDLIKPDGRSVNAELRALIALKESKTESDVKQEPEYKPVKAPKTVAESTGEPESKRQPEPRQEPKQEPEIKEALKPIECLPLPTKEPFDLVVRGVVEDHIIAAFSADEPKVRNFLAIQVPKIQDYCDARPSEEHRPKIGQMCLAKSGDGWARALTLDENDDGSRQLFFGDEGYTSDVKPKNIRKIPMEIREHPFILAVCRVVVEGASDPEEAWATIKTRIERDIEEDQITVFENVTSNVVDELWTVFIKL